MEVGYLRYFMRYLGKSANMLVHGKNGFFGENFKNLMPHEKLAVRRSFGELAIYGSLLALVTGLMAGGSKDNKKDLSDAERVALYYSLRMMKELDMYNVGFKNEMSQQLQYPVASGANLNNMYKLVTQIFNPGERYKRDAGIHDAGDLKIMTTIKNMFPAERNLEYLNGKFIRDIDSRLGYMESEVIGAPVGTKITNVPVHAQY
jgi:hypothetical protein